MQHPMAIHLGEAACPMRPLRKEVDSGRLTDASLVYLLVRGMGCPACAIRVHNALLAVEGVLSAEVSLEPGLARVFYDPAQVTVEALRQAVAAADPDGRHNYRAQIIVFSG